MDIALKQRLVGASVLIALAVVVLPMLLGGRPEGTIAESQKIEIPDQPEAFNFETRRYPIGDQTPPPPPRESGDAPISLPRPISANGQQASQPPELPMPSGSEGQSSAVAPGREQAEAVTPPHESPAPIADTVELESRRPVEVAPEASPGTSVPQTDSSGRYLVQVASFGSAGNANRLAERLRALDYAVLMDSVRSDVGTLHRVRVGPYATESAAAQAAAGISDNFSDVKPRVMDLEPGKGAQVTQPSDPLVRWVVQVGSFSSASNADKLVARLRLEAFSAYKEAVTTSGSTIYRVRVGPFVERDEAIRVDQQINQRLSLDGVVMSAD